MTTTDTMGGFPPPPPPTTERGLLRRNKSSRVAAGVCSGLGDYFGLDPVLFRVLFATAAFFGGAGILAYLLAWAAIPEAGTAHAPIDNLIAWMRRRRFPVWIAAAVGGLILWAVAFSWWAPGPFFPVVAVAILVVVVFARREMQPGTRAPSAPPVDLAKDTSTAGDSSTEPITTSTAPAAPTWSRDARAWYEEARASARERRRRSLPLRIAMLATLLVTVTVLAIVDGITGIQFQVYFWTVLGIVGVGLLAGLVTRRLPFSMTPLLLPAIAGVVAFGGSHASLHDGIGQRDWRPTAAAAADYRLMFGQGLLDLTALPQQGAARVIHVTMGAGQVRIIAPRTMNLTVLANVHMGQIENDGDAVDFTRTSGLGLSRVIPPPADTVGSPITVDVHVADGNISLEHR